MNGRTGAWMSRAWLVAAAAAVLASSVPAEAQPRGRRGPGGAPPAEAPAAPAPQAQPDKPAEKVEDRWLALTNATAYTVSGPVLRGVTILTKNGRIEAIGPGIAIPEKAEVLDVAGYRVYPGLVAALSGGLVGSSPAKDSTDVYSLALQTALAGGITTVNSGNEAAKLTYGTLEDLPLRGDLWVSLNYAGAGPRSRDELRRDFDRVVEHLREVERYEREKARNPEAKAPDDKWIRGKFEEYKKLLEKRATAVMTASRRSELLDAVHLAERYGISMVVRGGVEAWTVAPELARAGVGVILTPRTRIPADERLNAPSGSRIDNAAILRRHGVRVAVVPETQSVTFWGGAGRDLLHLNMEAAFAVRGGLSEADALRTITLDAAKLLGVDHRVGSIEPGKDADFVIADGDLLHYMTHARWTIVNGRIAYDKMKEPLFDHIRPGGDVDAPPPEDYWPRRLGSEPR